VKFVGVDGRPFCNKLHASMSMNADVTAELKDAIERILQSPSRKKLVVAGPGTGKTTLFRALVESGSGSQKTRLVLTFINNLKKDLEKSLSDLASIYTLHGYCQGLLKRHSDLRAGLTKDFLCFPGLASLIKIDWEYLKNELAPQFIGLMRNLIAGKEIGFYLDRANYYDAVDFDDSVYRAYSELKKDPSSMRGYDLVLIDEYQDFNRMEAAFIDLLAEKSPIVVAGDDDQALYSQLRGASWEHIRSLYTREDYEVFSLPFCMRCPEVIVGAVNDVIVRARQAEKLDGRIDKPYRHYEPVKGADSRLYPKIGLVTTTVQRLKANYFGRYIAQCIKQIPKEKIEEARKKGDPAVLIIGSKQYRNQIEGHLVEEGYTLDLSRDRVDEIERAQGLYILRENPASNLGWRIILEFEKEEFAASCIRNAASQGVSLGDVMPPEMKESVLKEAQALPATIEAEAEKDDTEIELNIKVTSFEGAKGLSAQHVFVVGLHEGDLPRDKENIQDIEICRFVVGLTRTKKKCSILVTKRFADQWKQPSPFIFWIKRDRYEEILVNADYWKET
jgi:superfamily I DNA/RNA helicase